MPVDTSPQQDLKGQLYKEIGKQMLQKEGELVFVPRASSCFLSDDFGQLSRAAQLHELGVHQVTSSASQFTPHAYDFTDLYESFIAEGGFEIRGKSQEDIIAYLQKAKEQRDKVDPETLKLQDKFEDLQDEFDDLEEEEREGKEGKKIARKLKGVKKLLRDKEVDQMLQDAGDKDPDIERLRKAIRKFLIHKKTYEVDPRAGEERTWDEDTYVDVDLTPGNFASILKTDSSGRNKSTKYEEFTTSVTKLKQSASEESTSWNASLDISYGCVDASGSVSSTETQSCSESSLGKLEIEMKLSSIWVTRKWFDIQLFCSDKIGSKADKKESWSSQRCPFLIEAVIVAKDVAIEGIQMSAQEKAQAKSLSANAKVSVMGFGGASGGYSSSSSSSSSSFDLEKGTYKCTAPHIVGYLCRPFPKFPLYDSEQATQAPCKTTEQRKQGSSKKFGALKNVEHLDQKKTNFCVRAAIATAVAAQVPIRTDQQVFLDQKTLYRTLIGKDSIKASDNSPNLSQKLKEMESGTDPKNFNLTYVVAFDKRDTPYKLKLLVRELAPEICPQNAEDGSQYLLGYDVNTQEGQGQADGFTAFHCVAVDEIREGWIVGFNSWGSTQQKPRMSIGGHFVTIWQILVQEVKELDVCLDEDERENLAAPLPQDTIALFDNSRETQNESFLSLFGAVNVPNEGKEADQIDSSSQKQFGTKGDMEQLSQTGTESQPEKFNAEQSSPREQLQETEQALQLANIQDEMDPAMDYDSQIVEMQKQNQELTNYLRETIDGSDIKDTLMPYTVVERNPVVSYREKQITTPKPHQFAKDEAGHQVSLLIHDGCLRWDQNILRFLTALSEMQGTIKAIKLDIENLGTRMKNLQRRGSFVQNKDFETQFESLNKSVKNFQLVLDKISAINNSCQTEINGSTADVSEMDENTKQIESQKKELHDQLNALQLQVFGASADLQQCVGAIEENEKCLNKTKLEVDNLLDQECKERQSKSSIESQNVSIAQEILSLQTEVVDLEAELKQVDVTIAAWDVRRREIDGGPEDLEAEDVFESEQRDLEITWKQKIDAFKKKLYALQEKKGDVSSPTATHFAYMCDSSSSVSDQDYKKMMEAISRMLHSRKQLAHASLDTYSLILFTGDAHQVELNQSIEKEFRAPPREHGGTDFNKAFKTGLQVVQANKAANQVIVFMTDGYGSYDKVSGLFGSKDFHECYRKWSSLRLFCIGYGNSYDTKALEAICKGGNGGHLQCILPDLVIDYIQYARDQDGLIATYDQINSQIAASEAHLQKKIDALKVVISEMEKEKELVISDLQKHIKSRKNMGATKKQEQLLTCDKKLKGYKERKSSISTSLSGKKSQIAKKESEKIEQMALLSSMQPRIDAAQKKREQAVQRLDKYYEEVGKQKEKLTDLRLKQASKAIEQAELTEENSRNQTLFQSHLGLQQDQQRIMIFIHEFQIQAKLIDQAIRNASYYITETAFFDQEKAVSLCMTKLASVYGVKFDKDKIKWQYQQFFVEILEKIFDKKNATDDDREIAEFLEKNFRIQEFIHEHLGLMVPGKVKKQQDDDDSDDETIMDRAKNHFGANAVTKWKKQMKTLDKRIDKMEQQKEKQEEKIDKEEDKSKPNKDKLGEMKQSYNELEISLAEYEKEFKALDRREDEVAERAETGKEKVRNFKNQFKQLERAIKEDALAAMTQQSLENIELNLATFAHGVIRNLQAMEQAIPKIVQLLKEGQAAP